MAIRKVFLSKSCIATAITMAFSAGAHAVDFEVGDGWKGNWSSSLSLGTSWRAKNPDSTLYGKANGALVGKTNGTGNNTIDVGNLNYGEGDTFTTQLKFITEVGISKGTMGAFFRGKAWYDYDLQDENVRLGNQPNGYNNYNAGTNSLGDREPLSDHQYERLTRFSGTYLLDAYVYDTFQVAGNPLQLRVGNQVVNWGESLFIQGVNQINPIDVPSFRKPGAQVKEVFLPVPIVLANQTLGDLGNVEMFYQWKWRNTPIEAGCGNYWGVAGGAIGVNPGACNNAVSLVNSPQGEAGGLFVNTIEGNKPSDSGQYGIAFRTYAEAIDSEIGVYAMNIHSRTPVISLQFGSQTGAGSNVPFAAKWEYPEDIKIYGLSLATNLYGWSVGAEVSYSKDVPAQIDGNDLLLSGLGATGLVNGSSIPFGPYGAGAIKALGSDGYLAGYTRTNKTQLQFNTIKVGNRILGADQYLFVGEVGFQWNDLDTDLRYNRPFIFGPGSDATYGGSTCGALNVNQEGCSTSSNGYVTPFAWGYRLKMDLTYNNVLNSGITVTPSVYFAHDVEGWSVDSQFSEGRMALGLGAKFSYAKKYTLELNAVKYNPNADFDPLRDRDFYSATFSTSF
ncbi:MAG: DUF1302 domain-containing protein [Denitromonas halophila]|nr:MAG: DUF1302 domain-containing protein [Denitromonas halophila]